jgi:hypothetical protein
MGAMSILPSPAALIEFGRTAVGQVLESVASLATVPVRALSLLSQAELLVSRITVISEQAEALVQRVAAVTGAAEDAAQQSRAIAAAAALAVEEASAVALSVTRVVDGAAATTDAARALVDEAAAVAAAASAVVGAAGTAATDARDLLDGYAPTLRKAAPLAARFVNELSPDEITAAIRMIDTLPRLRQHLVDDVMPLLSKLDQVGPDLHKLLEVTEDLHLAIAGLPGLKMFRRRGEDRVTGETA